MKVFIGVKGNDTYNPNKNHLIELKNSIENIDFDIESIFSEPGNENLIWETAKLGTRLASDTLKAGWKAQKALGRTIKDSRLAWNNRIKPMLKKMLVEFETQLKNIWATYKKYDKKYIQLGKDINATIEVYSRSMTSLPRTHLRYHAFDVNTLVGYMQIIQNYESYVSNILTNKKLFPTPMMSPRQFSQLISNGNINKAQQVVAELSTSVGNLNQNGELGIIRAMWIDKRSELDWFNKLDQRLLEMAISEKSSVTEFTEATILRGLIEKTYQSGGVGENNINEFKRDMFDNKKGYLRCMQRMLNDGIIEKILTKGAESIKKSVKQDLNDMENTIKTALAREMAKTNRDENIRKTEEAKMNKNISNDNNMYKGSQGNKQPQNSEGKLNSIADDLSRGLGPESVDDYGNEALKDFFNKSNSPDPKKGDVKDRYDSQYNPDGTPQSIVELADNYMQAYSILMARITATYTGIVRGTLSATYTLIAESTDIVNLMKSAMEPR